MVPLLLDLLKNNMKGGEKEKGSSKVLLSEDQVMVLMSVLSGFFFFVRSLSLSSGLLTAFFLFLQSLRCCSSPSVNSFPPIWWILSAS